MYIYLQQLQPNNNNKNYHMPTCSRQKKLGNITLRHFQNNGKKMPPEVLLISPINIKGTFNQ